MKGVGRRAVLGLALAAGAGALTACSSGDPAPSPSTADSASDLPLPVESAGPDASPPASGALRVADSGWSVESKGDGEVLSYGVIVENTTDRVAFQTTAAVRFVDASGKDVVAADSSFLDGRVTVVLPGEKVGFGATFLSEAKGIAKIEVALTTAEWWARDDPAREFAAIAAGEVATDRSHPPKHLMYDVTSDYSENLVGTRAAAVFRGENGEIVGGATAPEASPLPSGRSEGAFTVEYGMPLAASPGKTELYFPVLA